MKRDDSSLQTFLRAREGIVPLCSDLLRAHLEPEFSSGPQHWDRDVSE